MPLPTFSLLLVFSYKFCEILIFQYIILFGSYAIYYLLKNPEFYYSFLDTNSSKKKRHNTVKPSVSKLFGKRKKIYYRQVVYYPAGDLC